MKTKPLIITLIALIGLCSCGKSQEEKAQSMAANYLKGVLYHYDSYEPLQTKVDSSFVALSTDKEAIELTLDMLKLFQSAQGYADKVENAESSMEIWCPSGYSSAFSKGEYRRAKEERDSNQELLDKTKDRIHKQFFKIKSRQSYLEAEAPLKWGILMVGKCITNSKASMGQEHLIYLENTYSSAIRISMWNLHIQKKISMLLIKSWWRFQNRPSCLNLVKNYEKSYFNIESELC